MKKIALIKGLAIGLLIPGLAACEDSQDTGSEPDVRGVPIQFAVNTEYVRSGDITTNNLTSFNVYAYVGKGTEFKLFMNNVTVTKTSSNVWTYSPVAYWPVDEQVDFYAFAPSGWVTGTKPFGAVEYESLPGTEDIVYAVTTHQTGNTGTPNAQVLFNFRHALTKVSVKMSSTNTSLKVVVSDVALENIMTKGSFSFPNVSTADAPTVHNTGSWTGQNSPYDYSVYAAADQSELVTLTTTPLDMGTTALGVSGAKYLIPQELVWSSNGASDTDTFIKVECSIFDAATGSRLWPNDNTASENKVANSPYGDGILRFPLSTTKFSEWAPGTHYLYNLVINSNDEMGPIEFGDPTVDSFVEVESIYK